MLRISGAKRRYEIKQLKVLGTDNPADVFTKYVDSATLQKALIKMGLNAEAGRAKSATGIVTGEKK